MPSMLLGNPVASGAIRVMSGNPYSGTFGPTGGVQFRWVSSGGNCYIALSGGGPILSGTFMTINSGDIVATRGPASGMLDGFLMAPGDSYFLPALCFGKGPNSGFINVFALCDAVASGIGRLYWETF